MPLVIRALYASAASFIVLGVALFFALSRVERGAAAVNDAAGTPAVHGSASPGAPRGDVRSTESFALVVDSNMFSSARTAPRVRFTLAPAETAPAPTPPRPPGPPAVRVYGITLRSTDSTALIDADPRVPGAEIYRVGDSLPDGTLIVGMTDSTVVVEGTRGRRVLRLETKTRP